MMTQSEFLSKLNKAANTIARGSVRGSANYITVSKQWYDYFNNTKSEMRKEKINRILNAGEE
jgi:hypothetical protein